MNEIGASICGAPDGSILFGPWSTGTPTGVSVTVGCPSGADFLGVYHTHPGGIAVPSAQDIKAGLQVGAKYLCINADGDLRCWRKS